MLRRPLFHLPRTPERDVDEELRFHFDARIEDLMQGGMSRDEAHRVALAEFGDLHGVRQELNSSTRRRAARRNRGENLHALLDDLFFVGRSIRRAKRFAITIALTTGLGIGAAATVFGVVDRLLLRGPAHVVAPGSIRRAYAHIRSKASGEFTSSSLPYAAYVALRDHAHSITAAAAYAILEMRVGQGLDAQPARVGTATADFFPLLGVAPARGRFFNQTEAAPPGGTRVVVLDYGYWIRQLGSSDSVIGNVLTIGGDPYTIIGIAPKGFTGADLRAVDLWIPESSAFHSRTDWSTTWRAQWLNIVVRVKPNIAPQQVDDDITTTFRANYGGTDQVWKRADLSARDITFTSKGKPRDEATIARWLAAVAALLLLIATVNTANLLTVRTMRRYRETAVRMALGISRARLMRVQMLESSAYALLGCFTGLGAAYVGGEMMRRFLLSGIAWDASPLSARVLMFSFLATGGVALAVGCAPLPLLFHMSTGDALRAGAAIQSAGGARARRALLLAQTAVSVALLIGAGLFIRSLANVRSLDLGLEPGRVLVARVGSPRLGVYPRTAAEREQLANNWRELRDDVARVPGVDRVAIAIGSPFGAGFGINVRVPGRDTLPSAPGGGPYINSVSSEYFSAMGTRILRGRGFLPTDGADSRRVMVVNETMASLLWPSEDAIGKCVIVSASPCATVIGVARDARRFAIREPASMQYYLPFGQETEISGPVLLVRPARDARAFSQTLRTAIRAVVPDATFLDVALMQDLVDPQVRPWRIGTTMFTIFGLVALIVTAIGLYSVIAYSTAQRTREFGIRVAVGASSGRLMRIVLTEGLSIAIAGTVIGTAGAVIFGGLISPLLFEVSPTDPAVIGSVATLLVAVALAASIAPALRAANVDPIRALRAD